MHISTTYSLLSTPSWCYSAEWRAPYMNISSLLRNPPRYTNWSPARNCGTISPLNWWWCPVLHDPECYKVLQSCLLDWPWNSQTLLLLCRFEADHSLQYKVSNSVQDLHFHRCNIIWQQTFSYGIWFTVYSKHFI